MGISPIMLRPGVDVEKTPMLNEGGISASQLVRFFNGLLQKLGGWSRISNTALTGICRGLHPWLDLASNQYIMAGTNYLLQLWTAMGTIYEITPVAHTSAALVNPFATVINTPTVTVTDAVNHPAVGDYIYIATAANVGGLKLQGLYKVLTLPSPTKYTFNAGANATATVPAGGTTFSFTSAAASSIITFSLGTSVFVAGGTILVYVPTALSTLTLSGSYTLLSPTTFDAGSAAAGIDTKSENAGNVEILYLLGASPDPADPYTYGNGNYGFGSYGFGQGPTIAFYLRQWSLDNWGQIGIASPFNGAIYQWQPPVAYNNRATIVPVAPQFSVTVFVAMPQQQMVSLGSDGGSFQDPLLIKWSDVSDYSSPTSWTPLATNQAGSFRISSGSRIVGGFQASLQALVWTDIELWSMRYIQPPFVYGFNKLGTGCGLIAMRAAAELGGQVIWAGHKGIYQFNGQTVSPLPCSVWDFFYDNKDDAYDNAITAASNSDFNEWALYFPTLGSAGVNTSYIKYNTVSGVWDYGTLTRSAWIDRSDVAPEVGTDENAFLQAHETSNDADGAVMDSWAETAWFKLAEGMLYINWDRLIVDFIISSGGTVKVTVYVTDYPSGPIKTYGPFSVTSSTEYVVVRARGRLGKIRVESNDIGTFWRLGQLLSQGSPAGRR